MTTKSPQDALQDLVRMSEDTGLYEGEFAKHKESKMKELTDEQIYKIWYQTRGIGTVAFCGNFARAAIAADRALNAEDHDPLEPKRLESIADPTLRAVCEAYTNTPGGHFMRLQAIAKLIPARADRDVMRQAPDGWKLVPIEPTEEMLREGVMEQHGSATYRAVSRSGCSALEGEQYANYRAMLAAAPTPPAEQPVEMSPEFTDTARAALTWVLWHHQGANSPVGQPIRSALGMGQFDELSPRQIADAKRWDALKSAEQQGVREPAPMHAHRCAMNHFAFASCDCGVAKIAELRAKVETLKPHHVGVAEIINKEDVLALLGDKL